MDIFSQSILKAQTFHHDNAVETSVICKQMVILWIFSLASSIPLHQSGTSTKKKKKKAEDDWVSGKDEGEGVKITNFLEMHP